MPIAHKKRGGKGVKGAALKTDDVVEHFFTAINTQLVAVLYQ